MDNPVTFTPNPLPSESPRRNSNTSMSASNAGPAGFNFINVDPSVRTENSSSRTLIRANAGRYIWKRRKAGPKAKPYERPEQQPPPSSLLNSSENSEPPLKIDPNAPEIPSSKDEGNAETDKDVVLYEHQSSSGTTDLISPLRHGLKSPAMTFFGTEIPEITVRRTIKYCESASDHGCNILFR